MKVETQDLVIVGAGPAGLTAGVFACDRGLSTVVVEGGELGGQLSSLYPHKPVLNYPGVFGVTAEDLASQMVSQAERAGVQLLVGSSVTRIERVSGFFAVEAGDHRLSARAVVLACGMGLFVPRRLGIVGEQEAEGKNLFFSVSAPDSWRGLDVLVIGGGDSAGDNALLLAQTGARVTLAHRRVKLRAQKSTLEALEQARVPLLLGWTVESLSQNGRSVLTALRDGDGDVLQTWRFDRILVNIGVAANTSFLATLVVERHKDRVIADSEMATSLAGVFACGDVVDYPGKARLIVTAVGEAATAVGSVERYLNRLDQRRED